MATADVNIVPYWEVHYRISAVFPVLIAFVISRELVVLTRRQRTDHYELRGNPDGIVAP